MGNDTIYIDKTYIPLLFLIILYLDTYIYILWTHDKVCMHIHTHELEGI